MAFLIIKYHTFTSIKEEGKKVVHFCEMQYKVTFQ